MIQQTKVQMEDNMYKIITRAREGYNSSCFTKLFKLNKEGVVKVEGRM